MEPLVHAIVLALLLISLACMLQFVALLGSSESLQKRFPGMNIANASGKCSKASSSHDHLASGNVVFSKLNASLEWENQIMVDPYRVSKLLLSIQSHLASKTAKGITTTKCLTFCCLCLERWTKRVSKHLNLDFVGRQKSVCKHSFFFGTKRGSLLVFIVGSPSKSKGWRLQL